MNRKEKFILVTRPQPEADNLCRQLEQLGHQARSWPLLKIKFFRPDIGEIQKASGLIVTSKNALRALEPHLKPHLVPPALQDTPLFAVGQATAIMASKMGFTNIMTGGGTALSLVETIRQNVAGSSRRDGHFLLHLCGQKLAVDLATRLQAEGLSIHKQILYKSEKTTDVPDFVRDGLKEGKISSILLMSPRTSKTLLERLVSADILPLLQDRELVCLSEAVAAPLHTALSSISVKITIPATPSVNAVLQHFGKSSRQG